MFEDGRGQNMKDLATTNQKTVESFYKKKKNKKKTKRQCADETGLHYNTILKCTANMEKKAKGE